MAPIPLPMDIWWIIIDCLRNEKSPQHLSRLAQTCTWLRREANPLLYQRVRLLKRENAVSFANTMNLRPELKAFVKEILHNDDTGFADILGYSHPFYEQLATMENLQTLSMQQKYPRLRSSLLGKYENLVHKIARLPDIMWVNGERETQSVKEQLKKAGLSSEDPFGIGWNPLKLDSSLYPRILEDASRFCRGQVGHSVPPGLRECHVGGTTDLDDGSHMDFWDGFFNDSIFTLSNLKKLCITNCRFDCDTGPRRGRGRVFKGCLKGLKELNLLGCRICPIYLLSILRKTDGLERLIIRINRSVKITGQESQICTVIGETLVKYHGNTLQHLDLDLHWGKKTGIPLQELTSLKSLTVTSYSLKGTSSKTTSTLDNYFPQNIEELKIRNDACQILSLSSLRDVILGDNLPNLRMVTWEIPAEITWEVSTSLLLAEAEDQIRAFKTREVDLSVEIIPYFYHKPDYDVCPCEHLERFYHRELFYHRNLSSSEPDQ